MENLAGLIHAEAQKLIVRHERYSRRLTDEFRRRERRSVAPIPKPQTKRPAYWSVADGFNPYLSRARASRIGHSISRSITRRSYRPRNPIVYDVPKEDGSNRQVSVFQVADNAVSRMLYLSLMKRNRAKLSARSYAYRGDLTIHDAIQYIFAELDGEPRLFIAEFDFSRFFENISHDHVYRVLTDEKFLLTPEESDAIGAFMRVRSCQAAAYTALGGDPKTIGLPLGTSLSLFLANVAAWPLDRRLERLGVGYVRYADDTLLWSKDYDRLTAAVDALGEEVNHIGSTLNFEKSPGIRILTDRRAKTEMKATPTFTFVGHKFARLPGRDNRLAAGLSERKTSMVMGRVQELIYYNLLHEPLRGTQELARLSSVDKDYVALVWQLRRYIYGGLSERQLRRSLNGDIHATRFSGLLAYYPLIDDEERLVTLDAWMATQTWLALRKRAKILSGWGITLPAPHGVPRAELVRYRYTSRTTGGVLDMRLPSSRRMSELVRRAAMIHGPNTIGRYDPTAY